MVVTNWCGKPHENVPSQFDPITGRPTILFMNVGPYGMHSNWGISNAREDLRAAILHYYILGGLIRGLGLERTLFDDDPTFFADIGLSSSSSSLSTRKNILREFFEDTSSSSSSKIFREFVSSPSWRQSWSLH